MKAYDIIGWTFDGAMYCKDHKPAVLEDKQDEVNPIFAGSEVEPNDYCDMCLTTWIAETLPEERTEGASAYVYISGEKPESDEG